MYKISISGSFDAASLFWIIYFSCEIRQYWHSFCSDDNMIKFKFSDTWSSTLTYLKELFVGYVLLSLNILTACTLKRSWIVSLVFYLEFAMKIVHFPLMRDIKHWKKFNRELRKFTVCIFLKKSTELIFSTYFYRNQDEKFRNFGASVNLKHLNEKTAIFSEQFSSRLHVFIIIEFLKGIMKIFNSVLKFSVQLNEIVILSYSVVVVGSAKGSRLRKPTTANFQTVSIFKILFAVFHTTWIFLKTLT